MTIMTTDLDLETTDLSLRDRTGKPGALTIAEFCSMMTRRLGLLARGVPHDLPEPVPFELPPYLAG